MIQTVAVVREQVVMKYCPREGPVPGTISLTFIPKTFWTTSICGTLDVIKKPYRHKRRREENHGKVCDLLHLN